MCITWCASLFMNEEGLLWLLPLQMAKVTNWFPYLKRQISFCQKKTSRFTACPLTEKVLNDKMFTLRYWKSSVLALRFYLVCSDASCKIWVKINRQWPQCQRSTMSSFSCMLQNFSEHWLQWCHFLYPAHWSASQEWNYRTCNLRILPTLKNDPYFF